MQEEVDCSTCGITFDVTEVSIGTYQGKLRYHCSECVDAMREDAADARRDLERELRCERL